MDKKPFYEFGPFLLDPVQRVLLRAGTRVPLHPKTFLLLQKLVEAEGRIVGKDELLNHAWPDVIVEEINLTKNISLLRKAFTDNGGAAEFIETVPKLGYRFACPVAVAAVAATSSNAERNGQHAEAASLTSANHIRRIGGC